MLPTAGARPASAADLECARQCGLTTGATSAALATLLNKGLGLPYGKAATVPGASLRTIAAFAQCPDQGCATSVSLKT